MTRISRRKFLAGATLGVGGLVTGTGAATAGRPQRHVVGTRTAAATRAAERAATTVHHTLDFGGIGQAVAGVFSAAAITNLRRRPDVRYVEVDAPVHAIGQTVPWGVDRVDAEVAHASGETGSGANLAIIDTGIDSDHPDLVGNLGDGVAFVTARGRYAQPWDDDDGHGTHCAGIADAVDDSNGVVGVAGGTTLHAVKVLDKRGSGYTSDVAAGIEYVADQGWDVGSMSLGASAGTQTLQDACTYAANLGTLLVAAAGNSGGAVEYPATYDTVVAVSATDENDRLPNWSCRGPAVDLAAPGVDIYSTYAGGGYATLSGTSMACPHVSGAAAMLMATGQTASQARSTLTSSAEDVGLSSNEQGAGLLDVATAFGLDSSDDLSVDTTAPSAPSNLSTSGVTDTSVDLAWDASTSKDVDHYQVYVDGSAGPTTAVTSITVSGLSAGTSYTFTVTAVDGAGNESGASNAVTVTTTGTSAGNAAPTGTITGVTEIDDPSPHATFDVAWTASDVDGNLSTVTLTLTDDTTSGTREATSSTAVGGSSASGTTSLKAHKDEGTGHSYTVQLTVTDGSGSTGGDSTTTTEDGQ